MAEKVGASMGPTAKLGDAQKELELRIQERLKELEELKQAVESLKRSSQREIQESEKIFTQLIRSIEKIRSEVTELIGAQEKATVNQAEGIMKKLEQEIAELRRRNAELKQLSETKDHIHFLQNFQSLCAPPEAAVLPSIKVNSDISFGAVRKAVSQLKDYIEDFCKGKLAKITKTGSAHRYHPCADSGGAKMNTRCPPKRVPSAARFFTLCRLTVQPPQSYSVGGQRSSGQLTGKPTGARPDYRGRRCAVSQEHPGRPNPPSLPGDAQPIERLPLEAPVHGRLWNSLDSNSRRPGYRAHPAL
ncbi:UNVERIFIED_CONTAM: hypothetical protein FKN15_047926 [Acipenser sinensis]